MQQFNYFNTAKAAEMVAPEKRTSIKAAVAGAQAAGPYSLTILARGINTNQSNYTRFIIISRQQELAADADKITLIVSFETPARVPVTGSCPISPGIRST